MANWDDDITDETYTGYAPATPATYTPTQFDVSGIVSTGILVKNTSSTIVTREFTASNGASISNGTGIDGNPNITVSITGLVADASPDAAADYIMTYDASTGENKKVLIQNLPTSGGAVDSVNGQTGVVVLDTGDISAVTDKNYVTDAQLVVIGNTSGTNTGNQNLFSTIAVSGQSDVVADSVTDTLTLVAGTNITITTDAATDSITINSSGGGGISDGDKGDITVSSSGSVWTIDNNAVTFAKMQAVSANVLLGNDASGTAVEEITCTAAGRAILDDADNTAQRTTLGLGTLATQNGTFSGTSSGTNTGDQTSVTGNAGTATALQTPRTIGGVSFDGSANIVPQTIQSVSEASDTTCFPLFITASGTQSLQPMNNTSLTFNASTGALGATTLGGTLTTAAQTNITSVGTLTGGATGAGFTVALDTSTITGTLDVANGGTGQSTYTDGQLLIGNTSGNTLTKATLTAGTNITITNGNGSITINATGGGGLTQGQATALSWAKALN